MIFKVFFCYLRIGITAILALNGDEEGLPTGQPPLARTSHVTSARAIQAEVPTAVHSKSDSDYGFLYSFWDLFSQSMREYTNGMKHRRCRHFRMFDLFD